MITLFEGLWPLSIDRVWRGVSPLPGSERSLKTARTRFSISQVQVAFGVYSSVISESYRFQESSRRYRKTVVLRNRSMFDSRNSNCFNLASNYVCRARCGIERRRTMVWGFIRRSDSSLLARALKSSSFGIKESTNTDDWSKKEGASRPRAVHSARRRGEK